MDPYIEFKKDLGGIVVIHAFYNRSTLGRSGERPPCDPKRVTKKI